MLVGLALFSVVAFVASLIAIPWLLVRLPAGYFDVRAPRPFLSGRHPALRATAIVIKNVAGVIFLLAGIAMLVLPGQGVLTMLIGISMLDFPGKRQLEARLISQPALLTRINRLRARFGKAPFDLAPSP